MQEDKPLKKSVDPVVNQKVIKKQNHRWLLWLLLLLAAFLIFYWINHHTEKMATPTPKTVESSQPVISGEAASSYHGGNTFDNLTAWFAGDKKTDSGWFILDSLSFNSGSATPVVDDASQLQKIADILNKHPDSRVLIRGFADSTGSQEVNNKLSTQRAEAVKEWLVQHKVNQDQISIDGQGDAKPVASNATEKGREMNRRVALKILANKAGE